MESNVFTCKVSIDNTRTHARTHARTPDDQCLMYSKSSPVFQDTQFGQILDESLDFFNISEEDKDKYFLCDSKSRESCLQVTLNPYLLLQLSVLFLLKTPSQLYDQSISSLSLICF